MGWFNKTKNISPGDFTIMLVKFSMDFKQIYEILNESLPDTFRNLRKDDRAVIEVMISRAFIMTKLTNSLIDKEIGKQVLDDFHQMIFSAIENSDLKIEVNKFPQLLNDRYGEYYKSLDKLENDKDRDGSASYMFGVKIAAHILGIKENTREFFSIHPKIAMDCYIDFISLYNAERKVFLRIKDQIIPSQKPNKEDALASLYKDSGYSKDEIDVVLKLLSKNKEISPLGLSKKLNWGYAKACRMFDYLYAAGLAKQSGTYWK